MNDYMEYIGEVRRMTNCKNCGAVVNPNQCACSYCNTPYYPQISSKQLDAFTVCGISNILSPNEIRRAMDIDYNQKLDLLKEKNDE